MAVNPKKLRPYDKPPKVRRPVLPAAPDSAATAFLVAGLVWFMLAAGLGLLWTAMLLFGEQLAFSLAMPMFSGELTFAFSPATVSSGFWNALVYGWLSNAGLGAIFFITPRLLGRPLVDERFASVSAGLWNVGLLAGLAAIYAPQIAARGALTEFPLPVDGTLMLALLLANASFWRTLLTQLDALPYVSIWYFGVALLAFMGLYGLATLAPLLPLSDTAAALANAFYGRALETLWITGVAVGTLFYVIPRATLNPLYSSGMAMLAWVLWLGLATLAPVAVLVDVSVPFVITQFGNMVTLLLVAPAFLIVANLLQTINGRWSLMLSPGTLPFAVVALAFLTATAMLEAIGALGTVRGLVGGTDWHVGVRFFAFFGTATLAFLALADHAFPRLLRRDWSGTLLAESTLWSAFAGAGVAGLALIGGGIAHGSLLRDGAAAAAIDGTLFWFRSALGAGMALLGLAAVLLALNVFLMYTSARRADYVVVGDAGQAAPAAAGH